MKRLIWITCASAICLLATASNAELLTTQVQPLSGMGDAGESAVYWDFRLDKGRRSGVWTKIRVPAVWEQEGFGAYLYGIAARGKQDDDAVIPRERGVYRTTFEVPEHHRGSHVHIEATRAQCIVDQGDLIRADAVLSLQD